MVDNKDVAKSRNQKSFGQDIVADGGTERKAPAKQDAVHRTGKPPGGEASKS